MHKLAGKQFGVFKKHAIATHRVQHVEIVFAAHHKVVGAVTGRRMHCASTRIDGYVVAENNRHLPIVKRVLQFQTFQHGALEAAEQFKRIGAKAGQGFFVQLLRQHHRAIIERCDDVIQFRVQSHRLVGGQGPGRCGPDHQINCA